MFVCLYKVRKNNNEIFITLEFRRAKSLMRKVQCAQGNGMYMGQVESGYKSFGNLLFTNSGGENLQIGGLLQERVSKKIWLCQAL